MSIIATHLAIWIAVFAGAFIALQLFIAAAYVVVKVLLPERTDAIRKLQALHARAIYLAAHAADTLPKVFGWLLLGTFVVLTLLYS